MASVAQTESGDGHDNIDRLIERAQGVLDDFDRSRTNRGKAFEEVLAMFAQLVDGNDTLGREVESTKRNAIHLVARLDAAERREEDQRGRADAAENEVAELRGLLNAAQDRGRSQDRDLTVLREQHARLVQAFDEFLANLGDGARSIQDEDKRFVTATALARSRATYGNPEDRPATQGGGAQAGAFDGLLKRVSDVVSDDARLAPTARLTADEG